MFDDILGEKPEKKNEIKPPKLVKMKASQITALQEGDDKEYWVKLFHLDTTGVTKPKLIWKGKCKLYIQRDKHDRLSIITPEAGSIPIPNQTDWAEYSYRDIEPNGTCIAEDYGMEIYKEIK